MTDEVKSQINALDDRLQREMRLLGERNNARLDKIEERDKTRDNLDQEELRAFRHPVNK
jgi:hypothetical protein